MDNIYFDANYSDEKPCCFRLLMHCGQLCMQYDKLFCHYNWNNCIPRKSFVFLSCLLSFIDPFEKGWNDAFGSLIYHFDKNDQ